MNPLNQTYVEPNNVNSFFLDITANRITSEARCVSFMQYYASLTLEQKGQLFYELVTHHGVDTQSAVQAAQNIVTAKNLKELHTAYNTMRSTLRSRFKIFFSHLARVLGGVQFLVDLRKDVLKWRSSPSLELDAAVVSEVDSILKELFVQLFSLRPLTVDRINWNSPCDVLEKVCSYDATDKIRTWEDIKGRVGPYRRLYVFSHEYMPGEPLVIVHAALTSSLPSTLSAITESENREHTLPETGGYLKCNTSLSSTSTSSACLPPSSISSPPSKSLRVLEEDAKHMKCLVLYSITSTHTGLQGVEFGNTLIKSVISKVREELPRLSEFCTLSPIPGFRDWLIATVNHHLAMRGTAQSSGQSAPILLPVESSLLAQYKQPGQESCLETFKSLIVSHSWHQSEALTQIMTRPLMRLCAHYLYNQKRKNYALNSVANFHYSNGAVLWRIQVLADTSQRGLNQSCSLMATYRYFPESLDSNASNYLDNFYIQTSPEVLALL